MIVLESLLSKVWRGVALLGRVMISTELCAKMYKVNT